MSNTYLEICRAALPVAVRYANLDVVYTTFSALWADEDCRSWVRWRTTPTVVSECYQLSGLLLDTYRRIKADPQSEMKYRLKLFYQSAASRLGRDARALSIICSDPSRSFRGVEMTRAKAVYDRALIGDVSLNEIPFSDDSERDVAEALLLRARKGGLIQDRVTAALAASLIQVRGLDQERVLAEVAHDTKEAAVSLGRRPQASPIPWYYARGSSLWYRAVREASEKTGLSYSPLEEVAGLLLTYNITSTSEYDRLWRNCLDIDQQIRDNFPQIVTLIKDAFMKAAEECNDVKSEDSDNVQPGD